MEELLEVVCGKQPDGEHGGAWGAVCYLWVAWRGKHVQLQQHLRIGRWLCGNQADGWQLMSLQVCCGGSVLASGFWGVSFGSQLWNTCTPKLYELWRQPWV